MRFAKTDKSSARGAVPHGTRRALILPVMLTLVGCVSGQNLAMLPSPR